MRKASYEQEMCTSRNKPLNKAKRKEIRCQFLVKNVLERISVSVL